MFKEFNFYYPFLHNLPFDTSFSALNKNIWDYFPSRKLCDLIPIVISCLWIISFPAVRRYPHRIKKHKNKNVKSVYRTVKVVTIVWLPYKFPLGFSNVDTTVCGFYWKREVNFNQFRQSKATEVCSYHPLSCIPEVKNQGSFTSGHPCMAWFLT